VSFIYSSPPMLRLFGVEARKAEADATEDKSKGKKKPRKASKATLDRLFAQPEHKGMSQADLESMAEAIALESERVREADRQALRQLLSTLSTYTEREQAVLKNRIERWAFAQPLESDPGVVWEDLGIDALFLDEAQNMKNLWPYLRGDGGKPPKYLGAIDRPSQRALEFAIRAYLVRRKNGGSGVFLLSATPAKNSPIEYFSLLSLVDGEAWTKLGITDSGIFVTRYLKIERKRVLDTDLTQTTREVVVGFSEHSRATGCHQSTV
jgi:N12 class adenine-specific DNA methylase